MLGTFHNHQNYLGIRARSIQNHNPYREHVPIIKIFKIMYGIVSIYCQSTNIWFYFDQQHYSYIFPRIWNRTIHLFKKVKGTSVLSLNGDLVLSVYVQFNDFSFQTHGTLISNIFMSTWSDWSATWNKWTG